MAIDYDADIISQPAVEQIAHKIAPALDHSFETCTMHVKSRGGRACESCALALENRLQKLDGVCRVSASYRSGVLSLTYDHGQTSPDQLLHHIKQLGVQVHPSQAELPVVETTPAETTPGQRAWQWITEQNWEAIFTGVTLVAMLSAWLAECLALAPAIAITLYVIAYIAGGVFGVKGGLESLRERTIDVDLLMVLAALGAAAVGAPFEGALLLFLFSLSNVLQDYAMDRTRNAIKALMKLRPNQATIRRGTELVTMPVEDVALGDRFIIKPGDRIPLDGQVIDGESSVDQAAITGESMPVAKKVGDTLLAGTINKNGSLEAEVTKLAKDSTLARLIKMVEEAQSEKAKTQRFLDTAEQYYATGVIIFTILVAAVPVLFLNEAFDSAFYRAMTVMVAASPCALIISTPASILSAIGAGARRGVLFKGGAYVEQAATIKVIAFDKTGTLTEGKPQVTDVTLLDETASGLSENELLALAAAVESKSEHALGRATVEAATDRDLALSEALAFEAATGKGARGKVDGRDIRVGNLRYFADFNSVGLAEATAEVDRLKEEGKTAIVVGQIDDDGQTAHMLGVIAFADKLRSDAADVIADLKSLGVEHIVMLTGDNERVAQAIADEIGIDAFYANLMPEDKVRIVKQLEAEYGSVAMVGDGVNDAPALASATIGIAMGAAGTDVALETADVVLMADDLSNISYVIALSRQTRKTLITNLGFALAAIVIMLIAIFTANFPLPLAVIGHEGGTVLVSLNGLRLLMFKRQSAPSSRPRSSRPQLQPAS
ncbi:MAG: cadmium-translocating P-type ATPase [Anaerolineae bacterium]|nr:cadmium-translocating P-type ATPase [Anaerolineae bacterium]